MNLLIKVKKFTNLKDKSRAKIQRCKSSKITKRRFLFRKMKKQNLSKKPKIMRKVSKKVKKGMKLEKCRNRLRNKLRNS